MGNIFGVEAHINDRIDRARMAPDRTPAPSVLRDPSRDKYRDATWEDTFNRDGLLSAPAITATYHEVFNRIKQLAEHDQDAKLLAEVQGIKSVTRMEVEALRGVVIQYLRDKYSRKQDV